MCARQPRMELSDWSSSRPMGELRILRLRLSQAPTAGGERGISKPEAREGFRRSENDGTLLVKLLHTFNHGELGVFWTKLMTNFTVKDVN